MEPKQVRIRGPLIKKIEEIAEENEQTITNTTDELIQRGIKDLEAEIGDEDEPEVEEPDEEDGDKAPLAEDFQLQEVLRIAADYSQILSKKPLPRTVSIPELDKPSTVAGTVPEPVKKAPVVPHP